jgi:hypothetical protein
MRKFLAIQNKLNWKNNNFNKYENN